MAFLFGEHVVSQDDEFFCRLCQVKFTSYDAIYSHCQNTLHHTWCQECEMVFLDETELKQHMMDKECHHFCLDCENGVDYPDEESLRAHRAEAHFRCQECDLILASKRSLNTHLIYEHAACEVCIDVYLDMELYHLHMRTHPHNEYRCPGCDNKAETFSTIIQHLESSSDCGGLQQVLRLVKETPRFRDFYIHSGSGFDFYCKSCLLRWSTLGELALHIESTANCKWLLGPAEAFSYLREFLGRRRSQTSSSTSPPPWLSSSSSTSQH